ncbi:FK506-binding protein 1A [Diplonema papillatum]|nr:FK506-binding protein 1A [Diplonema papillatum]
MGNTAGQPQPDGGARVKQPATLGNVNPVELDEAGFMLSEISPCTLEVRPKKGDEAVFAFDCWLEDGTHVSSCSLMRSKVGVGRLIRGLEKALMRMCIGQRCKLICSPNHGYGLSGVPGTPIQASAILIFEVRLIDVTRKDQLPQPALLAFAEGGFGDGEGRRVVESYPEERVVQLVPDPRCKLPAGAAQAAGQQQRPPSASTFRNVSRSPRASSASPALLAHSAAT